MNQRVVKLTDCPSQEAVDYAKSLAVALDPQYAYMTIENYNKWWDRYGEIKGLGDVAYAVLKPFTGAVNMIAGKPVFEPGCEGCDRRRRFLNGEN